MNRLKLSEGDAFSTVVNAWWELRSSLDRIRDWREVAEACLENPTEASNRASLIKSVRKVLALLALACVSRNWAERHRGAANPLYDVPLRYLASVELCAGVLKDDTSGYAKLPVDFLRRQTSNKGDDVDVVGANCIDLLDYVPESGWHPEAVLEDASLALWKAVTKADKGLAFDVTDYSYLRTLLREQETCIAIHKQRAKHNPLLVQEVHAEFQQRFAGVTIFHFGVVVEGLDQPLIVEEGELMGLIRVFLKMLEP